MIQMLYCILGEQIFLIIEIMILIIIWVVLLNIRMIKAIIVCFSLEVIIRS